MANIIFICAKTSLNVMKTRSRHLALIFVLLFNPILMYSTFASDKITNTTSGDYVANIDAFSSDIASGLNATIKINTTDILREIPDNLLGSNIQYPEHGDFTMDEETLEFRMDIVKKILETGITTLRFPGGCHADVYHWYHGIGPNSSRPLGINYFTREPETNEYGIDEHIDLCELIDAEPTITVNFGNGTPQEAANWVEYCNGEIPEDGTSGWTTDSYLGNETAPDGYFAWLRGQYGNSEPYHISNWEIGNEVYNDWTAAYNATNYAEKFILFTQAMKNVDPTIKVGAIGYDDADGIWTGNDLPWNQVVSEIAGDYMDALHVHMYTPGDTDGHSVMMYSLDEKTEEVYIPEEGLYNLTLLGFGINSLYGPYPPNVDGVYSNLDILVNETVVENITLLERPCFYTKEIYLSSGYQNITIEFTNDIYDPITGDGRDAIFDGDVYLQKDDTEIIVEFMNTSNVYPAIMASPIQIRTELEEIKSVVQQYSGREDIELWITESNMLYNLYGLRSDQMVEFKSGIAMADIALQSIYAGVDIYQQWSINADWFFGMITDSDSLGERASYQPYKLLIDGLEENLLNTTITSPTFNVFEDLGRISNVSGVNYIDALSSLTQDGENISVIVINKHPTDFINTSIEFANYSVNSTVFMKTINSSAPTTVDQNPEANLYTFESGKINEAIRVNNTRPFYHTTVDNFFEDQGSFEFWIKPDWDGDDGLNHSLLSIAGTFQLIKTDGSVLAASLYSDKWDTGIMALGWAGDWDAGEWHHIAVTWDWNENLTLYIDGEMALPQFQTVAFDGMRTYFRPYNGLILGSSCMNRSQSLDGIVDEFYACDITLSSVDIQQHYQRGMNGQQLIVNESSTILLHFDNNLKDEQRDERTVVQYFTHNKSSQYSFNLPPCSITLLQFQKADDDDDDDSTNGGQDPDPNSDFPWLYVLIGSIGGVILLTMVMIRKKNRQPKEIDNEMDIELEFIEDSDVIK